MSYKYISDRHGEPITPADVYKPIRLLCGSLASFDHNSGISYRCNNCFATVGSVGMPKQCKEIYEMQEVVDKLKGTK